MDSTQPDTGISQPDSIMAGYLRHLATVIGAFIIFKLKLGPQWLDIVTGLLIVGFSLAWSRLNKLAVKDHINAALILTSGTSRAILNAVVHKVDVAGTVALPVEQQRQILTSAAVAAQKAG